MTINTKPSDLLDEASVHLIYAGQLVEMLSDIALNVYEKPNSTDQDKWMVDKTYALTHALRELLKSTKQEVDTANDPQAWALHHETFTGGGSTPVSAPYRTPTSNHQSQEVEA